MKKFIAIALFVCVFCLGTFISHETAICESVYGRAEKEGVGFYSSEIAVSPMFFLPVGYYVDIVGENGDFYSCEYAKTESDYTKKYGFVKKSDVYIDRNMALPLFPEIDVVAIKDVNLFSKPDMQVVISSISAGQKAQFYGIYKDVGATVYYVKINGDFGYVETSGFENLEIPTHPKQLSTYVSNVEVEDNKGDTGAESEDVFSESKGENAESLDDVIDLPKSDVFLAMILCIAVPALIFMFYAFKPRGGYFDE